MARINGNSVKVNGETISLEQALKKYFVNNDGEIVMEAWHTANDFLWFFEETYAIILAISAKETKKEIPSGSTDKAIAFYTHLFKSCLDPFKWKDSRIALEHYASTFDEFGSDISLKLRKSISERLDKVMNNEFYKAPLAGVPIYMAVFTSFMSLVMMIHHYTVYAKSGNREDFELSRSNMMLVFRFIGNIAMLINNDASVYIQMAAITDAFGYRALDKLEGK